MKSREGPSQKVIGRSPRFWRNICKVLRTVQVNTLAMRTSFPWVLSVTDVVSDLLLFSCLAAFYTGIVLAIASLLN